MELLQNIWKSPKTSLAGLLIGITTIAGVLSQDGITLGKAGTGTVIALIAGIASALLGLLSRDPAASPASASSANSNLKATLWLVAGVLGFAAMTALCAWTSSCGSSLHKSAVAADSIANSLKTAADLDAQLYASGQISLLERQQMATYIDQATQANDVLIAQLTQAEASGAQPNAASLVAAFGAFSAQLQTLETNGVLHLKSAQAQAQFETILNSVKASVAIIQIEVGSQSRNRMPLRLPFGGGIVAFAGLALTPDEIAALIGLATAAFGDGAALVSKLIGMKGQADAALLADATAEDDAARTEAKAEEAAQ
jgi:hypothetical protein